MSVANCPSCGGPIEFKVGSSAVVICDYCRSVVARTDRALEDLGKVAALVDTGSPLKRDLPGKYKGVGFRITGRTQMRHAMGGLWDEWYAAFDDGRWGWVAEAQGRYYVTFATPANDLPPRNVIEVGGRYRGLVIDEIGTAAVVAGEGEIPWRVEPNASYDYADLSGPNARFATIDYSEAQPLFFAGEMVSLAALGIDARLEQAARAPRASVQALNCPNCGGPINLVAPDQAERVICPNCGGALDVTQGKLQFLQVLKHKGPKPLIPLGTTGTLEGEQYIVAGAMQRSVTFDKKYFWTEYLLFHLKSKGFRWLVDSDHHWSLAESIPSADVDDPVRAGAATAIMQGGRRYRIYQDAKARVEHVLGEFYWRVEVGETARAIDYIAPPFGITKEISGTKQSREINYSLAHYVPVDAIEAAFNVKLERPTTVGTLQPYDGVSIGPVYFALLMALIVVSIVLGVTRPNRVVYKDTITFEAPPPWSDSSTTTSSTTTSTDTANTAKPADSARVHFTKPFAIEGNHNLRIEAYANVTNTWMYVAGDIANESTGMLESFDLPLEYYEGVDDGERWTEGDRWKVVYLSALPKGTYSMRLEGQWEKSPVPVTIEVREGVFRWSHFWLAFFLITIPAIPLSFGRIGFETRRWSDSSFTPAGTARTFGGDDDDEE